MSTPEHPLAEAARQIQRWSGDASRLARRARKRKLLQRIVRSALWMMFTTFVVIPSLMAAGLLFGPRGVEGLILAPAALFSLWAFILYWYFGRKPSPRSLRKVEVALLPAQTESWLDDQRMALPSQAQGRIDVILQQLEALTPQAAAIDAQGPAAHELRRLLSDELPELVRSYAKVPAKLRQQPLYGGKTPEHQLLEGLETLEREIADLHERLAKSDLHALATHQRYLDLKYNRKGKID
jgi:hypothetical protein